MHVHLGVGVWALLLEHSHPRLATDVFYVAGDRVVSDPLCKPFSMGRSARLPALWVLCVACTFALSIWFPEGWAGISHSVKQSDLRSKLLGEVGM